MNAMQLASQIVKHLKAQTFPDDQVRGARALFVAQTLAHRVKINTEDSQADQTAKAQPQFLKVLNAINEFLPVDTRLAQELFTRILSVRWDLARGAMSPTLMMMALTSEELQKKLSPELQDIAQAIASKRDYRQAQDALEGPVLSYLVATQEGE